MPKIALGALLCAVAGFHKIHQSRNFIGTFWLSFKMSIRDFNWKTQRALGKILISKPPKINQKSKINSAELFTSEKWKPKRPSIIAAIFPNCWCKKNTSVKNKFTFETQIRPQLKDRTATAHNVLRTGAVWDWWPKSINLKRSYTETQMINLTKCPKLRLVRCYAPLPVFKRFIRAEISSGRFGFPSNCVFVTSIEKHKEL